MTFEIRRLPLGPVAKVSFVLYFVIAFIMVLLYSTFMLSMLRTVGGFFDEFDFPFSPGFSGPMVIIGGLFGATMLAALYTVLTIILALVYNAIASLIGGLSLEIQSDEFDILSHRIKSLEIENSAFQEQSSEKIEPASKPDQKTGLDQPPGL